VSDGRATPTGQGHRPGNATMGAGLRPTAKAVDKPPDPTERAWFRQKWDVRRKHEAALVYVANSEPAIWVRGWDEQACQSKSRYPTN
jgi:hypothetical protein